MQRLGAQRRIGLRHVWIALGLLALLSGNGNCSTFSSVVDPGIEGPVEDSGIVFGGGGTTGSGGSAGKNTGGTTPVAGAGGTAGAKAGSGGVEAGAGGADASLGGAGGAAGADASAEASVQCNYKGATTACTNCVKTNCQTECVACYANSECLALIDCLNGCAGDPTCSNDCPNNHQNGVMDMLAFVGVGSGCVDAQCESKCGAAGAGGSGGSGGKGGSGGSAGKGGSGGTAGKGGTAGSAGTGGSGTTDEDICVAKINTLRASAGVGALTRWKAQETCADTHAQALAQGTPPSYSDCSALGVTACSGGQPPISTATPACLDLLWSQANSHTILANAGYTKVACGAVVSGGAVYLTQYFQ